MSAIRLPRLPERTPIKVTISIMPEVHQLLSEYGVFYAEIYGKEEALADLVPAMVTSFIEADKAFAKARPRLCPPLPKSENGNG